LKRSTQSKIYYCWYRLCTSAGRAYWLQSGEVMAGLVVSGNYVDRKGLCDYLPSPTSARRMSVLRRSTKGAVHCDCGSRRRPCLLRARCTGWGRRRHQEIVSDCRSMQLDGGWTSLLYRTVTTVLQTSHAPWQGGFWGRKLHLDVPLKRRIWLGIPQKYVHD
jgi:hypothetical protein